MGITFSKFYTLLANSVDPDQLASYETSCSWSTHFIYMINPHYEKNHHWIANLRLKKHPENQYSSLLSLSSLFSNTCSIILWVAGTIPPPPLQYNSLLASSSLFSNTWSIILWVAGTITIEPLLLPQASFPWDGIYTVAVTWAGGSSLHWQQKFKYQKTCAVPI